MTLKLKSLFVLMSSIALCTGFTIVNEEKTNLLDDDSTRSFVYNDHYYGYCNGPNIVRVYNGYITLPSRVAKIEKKLDNVYYDDVFNEFSTPYVIYRYTDDKGNAVIPLIHNSVTAADLTVDTGSFGKCPGFTWE